MTDLASGGETENVQPALVQGEEPAAPAPAPGPAPVPAPAEHVVVQIDEKPAEAEQLQDGVQVEQAVKEEVKEEEVKEEVGEEAKEEEAVTVTGGEVLEAGEVVMGEEGDRDSLVPGTGSINGDLDEEDEEEDSDEDGEEENMGNVVQGTTETILNKLEENLSQAPPVAEGDLLQVGFVFISQFQSFFEDC